MVFSKACDGQGDREMLVVGGALEKSQCPLTLLGSAEWCMRWAQALSNLLGVTGALGGFSRVHGTGDFLSVDGDAENTPMSVCFP